jgi:hypothetical protein
MVLPSSEVSEMATLDAFTMGYVAWGTYGTLSFFNFLYYSDSFYRKYVMSDFTEGAQWRTLNGYMEWVRTLINVALWGTMLLAWSTTIFT